MGNPLALRGWGCLAHGDQLRALVAPNLPLPPARCLLAGAGEVTSGVKESILACALGIRREWRVTLWTATPPAGWWQAAGQSRAVGGRSTLGAPGPLPPANPGPVPARLGSTPVSAGHSPAPRPGPGWRVPTTGPSEVAGRAVGAAAASRRGMASAAGRWALQGSQRRGVGQVHRGCACRSGPTTPEQSLGG